MIWSWFSMRTECCGATVLSGSVLQVTHASARVGILGWSMIVLCGLLAGCIPIPVRNPSGPIPQSRDPISEQRWSKFVSGVTTRAEVLLALGEPDSRGPGDKQFSYISAVGLGGVSWWDVPLVSVVGGESYRVQRLLIRFDDVGIVSAVEPESRTCVLKPSTAMKVNDSACPSDLLTDN